ncbi:MAG: hypothetical protein JZU65_00360 [Chlorobium sp.]|nr:hypothetical protein [Chlorobium sp.]
MFTSMQYGFRYAQLQDWLAKALFILIFLFFYGTAHAAVGSLTPAPGSSERRAVLDVLRSKVRELHEIDVVFVVRKLNVQGGWAWVETLPQTADGTGRYESFAALMRKKAGIWRILEIPCAEPDNPDCIDSPGYFSKLKKRFSGLPHEILPE